MWNNLPGDALGRIQISTNAGKGMYAGCTYTDNLYGVLVPLGSGILIGANGTTGSMMHSITWQFLSSKVARARMVDVKYDESLDAWNEKHR